MEKKPIRKYNTILDHEATEIMFNRCPFCGEIPNVFTVPDDRYIKGEMNWVVECKQMGCMFQRSSPNRSLRNLQEHWNIRA